MAELAAQGNLARVIAAQERLFSAAERTGKSLQRMERYFDRAVQAGNRLSQITARPAIVLRDYFSFAIERLLLQLADISNMKVELKLIVNYQAVTRVKQMLKGLGGTLNVKLQGHGTNVNSSSQTTASTAQAIPIVQITQSIGSSGNKSAVDEWIERFSKIASGLKNLGDAFKSLGSGMKNLVESIKILKDLFGKGGNTDPTPNSGEKTKPKTADKTEPKAKEKTDPRTSDKTDLKMKDKTDPKAKDMTDPKIKERTEPKSSTVLDSVPKKAVKSSIPLKGGMEKILQGGTKAIKWVSKAASKAAAPLGVAMTVADIATSDNKKEGAVKAGSSLTGSVIGGAIGTAVLPGVGTLVGSMLGRLAGDALGGFLSDKFFGKKKPVEKPPETSLIANDRQSPAASPTDTTNSKGMSPANSANVSNYNIAVNGVTVNFPKEEIDEDAMALRIGQQIVSQMNAVMPNQV